MVDIEKIYQILESNYLGACCELNSKNPFELIVSARLSAQCRDERVNSVTPRLFKKFPNVDSLANASLNEIEEIIKPCGLFKTKSKDLKNMCIELRDKFDSEIPFGLENLQKLSGIGRKTANLVMSEVFGQPSIIVDTHVARITKKIGIHNEKDPFKIEMILQKIVKKPNWSKFCHYLVHHGRKVCFARSPNCEGCCIKKYCKSGNENYGKKRNENR